jgi:hypothetical protein
LYDDARTVIEAANDTDIDAQGLGAAQLIRPVNSLIPPGRASGRRQG